VTSNPPLELSRPEILESDIQRVVEVLRSGRLALGPRLEEFERAVAQRAGVACAVAVSSGTAALHLVVKALGLGPGDEVLVPSFTFAATVNALLYEGVRPVFAEVEDGTFNLDPADLDARITPRTRGILAVDAFGHPAEWEALEDLASRRNLLLVDDCCEALGARYRDRPLGSFGRAGTFAFYPNKQITTGEGGMVVTDDPALARTVRSLANQGRGAMGAWLRHDLLGHNYRMSEVNAALGLGQMERLDAILQARDRVADLYAERLAGLPGVRPPVVRPHVRVSRFVYVVTLEEGMDRDRVITRLEAQGVPARGYFAPIHTQPYLRDRMGDLEGSLPRTEALARRTLALPFHNRLGAAQVDRVVKALERAL
jgi:perosamine synthetase